MSLKSRTRKLWLHENYVKFGAAEVEKKVDTESAEDVRIIGCVIGDVKHSLHIGHICMDNRRGRSEGFYSEDGGDFLALVIDFDGGCLPTCSTKYEKGNDVI